MVEADKSQPPRESRLRVGMEVLILEHRTPLGGYCLSSKGTVIKIDAGAPLIQCNNPVCQKIGVSIDTKNKV